MLRSLSLAAIGVACGATGLVDSPLVSGAALSYLDGYWQTTNGQITIGASVPGDLLTDLQR